ncbi:hypothetical protein O3P69_011026 [Scylla paramamosain]|uniref:PiggyBac transposable element-derived protein domain-containing protein n=1 Tax=Scylla paramamosain TaxID=85552 RepID=A0AAW0S9R6_SCYPA
MSKLLSLAEAVALVLEEDGEEINILPPEEDQALTDEENIDDNLLVYVERWSVTERKKIRVQQPNMIQSYNKFMGGVDLMDRFVAQYRPSIRSKKWAKWSPCPYENADGTCVCLKHKTGKMPVL